MTELRLPSLGEGIEKGTVISIAVKVGDIVAAEQILMEVETDKVVIEVPADTGGEIMDILVNLGDEITEGAPILALDGESADEMRPDLISIASEATEMTLVKAPKVQHKTEEKKPKPDLTSINLKLPSLGEGIEKGIVIAIHVKEGDKVTVEQSLMEVETDKVVVEVPADASGEIEQLLVVVGDEVSEGVPILKLRKVAVEEVENPIQIPIEKKTTSFAIEKKKKETSKEYTPIKTERNGVYRASPLAKKIAREIGIAIAAIPLHDGKKRISVQDVKDYAKALNQNRNTMAAPKATISLPDFSKWGAIRKESMSGIGQVTSKNMTTTWSQIPHAWLQEKIDITNLEAKRQQHKQQVKEMGGALTLTSILVKVVAKALQKFPIFNASFDEAAAEVIFKEYINIGVAVDSDRGLMVPVLEGASDKGLLEIAKNLSSLSRKVRDKKIKPEELQRGTFTISNLGGIGTTAIFPLVNHPQVAILGVAGSQTEAVWENGQFEARLLMPLTIGFDHRIINGADAARFLQYVKQLLEDWFVWNL